MEDNNNNNEPPKFAELFKRAVSTGLGAAVSTEEIVKGLINDRKEIVSEMIQSVKGVKEDVVSLLKKEVHSYLEHLDVSKEIDRILENYSVDIQANVSFKKKKPNPEKKK